MHNTSCFLVGLPGAGKSTFLAALWYSINQVGQTTLTLDSLTGDQTYLQAIQNSWIDYSPLARTSLDLQEEEISIQLRNKFENKINLIVPDFSGEIFKKQYTQRVIDAAVHDFIISTDNFILFVNPLNNKKLELISNVPSCHRTTDDNEDSTREPWEDCTSVQLVEILQFIQHVKNSKKSNLVIIISAWDTVEEKELTPKEYLKEDVSLLWQYISTNECLWNANYFAISAQGGSLESEEKRDRLIEQTHDPIKRIQVIDNEGNVSNDITIPLNYILGQLNNESKQ